MRRVPIQDVFAAVVPNTIDVSTEEARQDVPAMLTGLAQLQVWNQYVGHVTPSGIEFEEIDWLVTRDPEELERFQPAHDCAACRAGNDQARAFLRENPDRYVALANISYVEIWQS